LHSFADLAFVWLWTKLPVAASTATFEEHNAFLLKGFHQQQGLVTSHLSDLAHVRIAQRLMGQRSKHAGLGVFKAQPPINMIGESVQKQTVGSTG